MATCPTCRTKYPNEVTTCERDGDRLLADEAFTGVDPDLVEGQVVGEYHVRRKLGEGGFGSVYSAVHPLIGKTAAIKVLNRQYSSSPQMVSRFIAEARAVNQIRHRNIIDIFSFGTLEDGRQYYVMELLEGATCDGYIAQKGRLGPEEAIPILRGIARALDAAHAAGIAHRDLKPENIYLVFDEDGGVFPKLLDFGIAKLLGESGMSGHKTRTGTPMGTPHYMSPEQCRGKNIDHRTDIYSFGVLTHAILTGRVPFDGEDVMDILFHQMHSAAPRMSSVCPEVPPSLDAPVLHMLEKDPGARPESLTAAVDALARAASEAGYAVQVSSGRGRRDRGVGGGTTPADPAAMPLPGTTPGTLRPLKLTPAQAELAQAKTIAQPDLTAKTVLAAEAQAAPPPKKRAAVLLGAAAVAVGAIAMVYVARSGSAPASGDTTPRLQPEAATASALPTAPPVEPAPEVRTTEVAPAAPAVPSEVELTVQATPPGAEVFLGTAKLGVAPGPFRVKRSDASLKLTVKAPGHSPRDIDVTPTANAVLQIALTKAPTQRRPEVEF